MGMKIYLLPLAAIAIMMINSTIVADKPPLWAQTDSAEFFIEGRVEQISEDETYMIINGKKICTDNNFVRVHRVEKDNLVKIIVENTGKELVARDYKYIVDCP